MNPLKIVSVDNSRSPVGRRSEAQARFDREWDVDPGQFDPNRNALECIRVARIKGIEELNIGHSIISRAVMVGLTQAVREMKELIR